MSLPVPNDPLFPFSWHLLNTGQNGGLAGIDIRILPVWEHYRGAGITVAVVDDGVADTLSQAVSLLKAPKPQSHKTIQIQRYNA
ncbi:hypothetical protein [Falsiroseomonas selenitidurans]|uniref:Uncharacterized protein n=1 Tax=Falsiroseomonas selenitidurans TaxID=2716335 RepID=A0ABX1E1U5_9PROT|nr:hypothetical protein [Falsiroseomonas selenitidurans]NKC31061.1 hypothetical protein [Falsiroseomonas selenitidurans]